VTSSPYYWLAVANAIVGDTAIHDDYFTVDPYASGNLIYQQGNTYYVLVPSQTIPILFGLDIIFPQLDGVVGALINSAYNRPETETAAQQGITLPPINPPGASSPAVKVASPAPSIAEPAASSLRPTPTPIPAPRIVTSSGSGSASAKTPAGSSTSTGTSTRSGSTSASTSTGATTSATPGVVVSAGVAKSGSKTSLGIVGADRGHQSISIPGAARPPSGVSSVASADAASSSTQTTGQTTASVVTPKHKASESGGSSSTSRRHR
jgi:PE-PPE domain